MAKRTKTEEPVQAEAVEATAVEDGMLLDYVTQQPVKDTPKEQVRQFVVRALVHELRISPSDMAIDFPVTVGGRKKKLDVAVFRAGSEEHTVENLRRAVICQKQPSNGKKSVPKLRDHDQAKEDLQELEGFMTEVPECKWGLWTNGLDIFYVEKEQTRFDVKFKPIGYWPLADESQGTADIVSSARMRRADAEMLRLAFRRCHNFIHGNEGMPKDAAFWQFLYLIFSKMYDERQRGEHRRFWAGPGDQFTPEGRKAIRKRIEPLFNDVKNEFSTIFRGNEEITLSDRALAFMVSELAKYDFSHTDVDAKGAAYQEIVGTNLRGDRGQYFTPRGAIKLMVEMLDPKPTEKVLDPACGTGGFLVAVIDYMVKRCREELKKEKGESSTALFDEVDVRVRDYVEKRLFGADFDPFLVRATTMNLMMAAGAKGNVFNMDSLSFPQGHLSGVEEAKKRAKLGSIDVLMTNPPFGSDIPITDPAVLREYDLAAKWEKKDGEIIRGDGYQSAVAPEVLFIQRAVDWLRPGGRLGIVLPDGILGNPGDEHIRKWILRHCWVLASVDLPVECFIVEANVNILTSLLFLKKKTREEIQAEDLGRVIDYPVFMAVAEKVGFDRRGNTLYKRSPDGEELVEKVAEEEKIRINGKLVTRILERNQKIVDDDLPAIAEAYRKFRAENPEPGA